MDRLDNTVRPYAWGSTTAIPQLLGVAPTGEPQAEMWMGAHPGAPSRTGRGPLTEVIDEAPERELGRRTVARFGPRLPFLLKLLAARRPALPPGPPRPRTGQGGLRGRGTARRPDRRGPPQLQGRQPQAGTDLRPHGVRRPLRLPGPAPGRRPARRPRRRLPEAVRRPPARPPRRGRAARGVDRGPGRRPRGDGPHGHRGRGRLRPSRRRLRPVRRHRPPLPGRPRRHRSHAPQPRTPAARRGPVPRRRRSRTRI